MPADAVSQSADTANVIVTPAVRLILTGCTVAAALMQALDGTIANVALPYMQGTMSASQDEINWVLTSYIVSAAIMTAPTGFLAARFGRTRVFTVSILGFTFASILCGAAQTLDQMVLFRLLQGLFGASLVPLSQAVMFDIYPLSRRGQAIALWALGVQVGPIMGPILGGYLTEHFSWRWVFYINVPFGLVAAILLPIFLKETVRREKLSLDWIGFGALSLAIGAFQLMLDRGETKDWFNSPEIIAEACVAGLGFYIFLVQSVLSPKPFLSPRLFRDVNYIVGLSFIFMIGLVIFATLALLVPFVQVLMNYPVVTAGLLFAPRGIGSMVAMIFCGALVNKVDVRILVGFGLILSAYSVWVMIGWTADVSPLSIAIEGIFQGVGTSFVFVPLSTITFTTLPVELRTEATGVYSLMRNLGSAIGISITSALLQQYTQVNHAIIAGAVTPFNRALQHGAAAVYWNPLLTGPAALLNSEVTRQANVIAFEDDFKLMLVMTVLVFPMLLLIRLPRTGVTVARPAVVE